MKYTKIFNGNQYVTKFNCDGKKYSKFQLFKIRCKQALVILILLGVASGVVSGSFWIGRYTTDPITVEAIKEVPVEVETPSPVMERIAKCESGGRHTHNGQVVFNANSNDSVDIGLFQINSLWSKKATELGYNLTIEKDNRAFAMYLYKNFGTSPWSASSKCWQ